MPETTITYGVEIECSIPSFGSSPQARIAQDLQALGVNARSTAYSGRDYSVWQIKPDCSLRSSDGHQGTCELVSPILTWGSEESDRQLVVVSEYLVSIGANVNSSCGGHVHLSVGHLTGSQLARFIENYAEEASRPAIDGLIVSNRRYSNGGANYCRPTPLSDIREAARFARNDNRRYAASYMGSHGNMINGDWYSERGTVEVRQRQSSVNHYKIRGWVGFLVGLIRMAENDEAINPLNTETMLTEMVEGEYITPVLRDWVMGTVPRITVERLADTIAAARTEARQAVSRLMRLQGVSV